LLNDFFEDRIKSFYVCCKIKMDKVAKGIPHFCSDKFPTIAKGH
jgi:hypothetical protein